MRPRLTRLVLASAFAVPVIVTRVGDAAASFIQMADRLPDDRAMVSVPMTAGTCLGAAAGPPLAMVTALVCLPVYPAYDSLQEHHHGAFEQCYWLGAWAFLESAAAGAVVLGVPFYGLARLMGHADAERPRESKP